jgi:hypothetical protein
MTDTITWNVEYTDTYGGEANYCWVNRQDIETPRNAKQALIMRRAKASVGLTGARGRTYWHGDSGEFRPYRSCTVMFVTFPY